MSGVEGLGNELVRWAGRNRKCRRRAARERDRHRGSRTVEDLVAQPVRDLVKFPQVGTAFLVPLALDLAEDGRDVPSRPGLCSIFAEQVHQFHSLHWTDGWS